MDFDPARMVVGRGRLQTIQQGQLAIGLLAMRPHLVGLEVGAVQERLGGIEDHAVDPGGRVILVVLDILGQTTVVLDGEDIAIASVLVEGIPVDIVGGLPGGQNEDGTGVGVCARGESCLFDALNSVSHLHRDYRRGG